MNVVRTCSTPILRSERHYLYVKEKRLVAVAWLELNVEPLVLLGVSGDSNMQSVSIMANVA